MNRRSTLSFRIVGRHAALLTALFVASITPGTSRGNDEAGDTDRGLLVFAAASMTEVLGELGEEYRNATGRQVRFSFAASSALARQIEAGAGADLYVSADEDWMDYLAERSLIDPSSRRDLAGNALVLIAPADSRVNLRIGTHIDLVPALGNGRLALADPDIVPAGRYARAALLTLGAWAGVQDRLARAENVRVALAWVARGEAPLGIVYATDARIEPRVRIVGLLPATTHPPIRYPAAVTRGAGAEAHAFLEFVSSAQGRATFARHGFLTPD